MVFSMKALKCLRVDIVVIAPWMSQQHEDIFFNPLLDLPRSVEAEVCVPWKKHAYVLVDDETFPFVLRRETGRLGAALI